MTAESHCARERCRHGAWYLVNSTPPWLAPVDCPAEEWQQVYDADDAVTVVVPLTAEQVYWLGKAS